MKVISPVGKNLPMMSSSIPDVKWQPFASFSLAEFASLVKSFPKELILKS